MGVPSINYQSDRFNTLGNSSYRQAVHRGFYTLAGGGVVKYGRLESNVTHPAVEEVDCLWWDLVPDVPLTN